MKLKRFFSFLLLAAVITAFTACDEDEDTSVPVDVPSILRLHRTRSPRSHGPKARLLSQTSTVGKNTSSTCPKVPSSHFLRDFITSRSKEPSPALRAKSSAMYAARKTTYKSLPHRLRSLWSYRSTPRATPLFSKRFM